MKLAMLVLLAACASPRQVAHPPISLVAHEGIRQTDVDAAADWWSARLGCDVFTNLRVGPGDIDVVLAPRPADAGRRFASWDARRRIEVYAAVDVTVIHAALVHELGHVLGLGHSPDDRSIMYADIPMPSLLGDEDEFARFPWVEQASIETLRTLHCKEN